MEDEAKKSSFRRRPFVSFRFFPLRSFPSLRSHDPVPGVHLRSRFWKQGYWRSHLQHRKYHISALYVVDLKKFRRIAAGDRLRGQYQGLSQDPNSLSNLDQVR